MINNATYKQTPIGLIPNDWEVMEFGNFAELQKGKYVPVNDEVKKCQMPSEVESDIYSCGCKC